MRGIDRRRFCTGLGAGIGAALLSGCAAEPRRLAEADKRPAEGGIGGTGIVGTLTGFGSLLINGLRVELPRDAKLSDAFGPVDAGALSLEQALTVEAAPGPAGPDGGQALQARRVHITDPLIGTIAEVSADGRGFAVNGTAVTLAPGLPSLGAGSERMRVVVSGIWRAGGVVATRLAPAPARARGRDLLAGVLRRTGATGYSIEAAPIRLPAGAVLPEPGSFVTLTGQYMAQPGLFLAETVVPGRFTGAAGALTRLSVEGYLDPVQTAPGYVLAGLGHSFDAAAQLTALAARRSLFTGPYTGTFDVQNALPLPEAAEPRHSLLEELRQRPDAVPVVSTR
ncbi:MAG: hypothetical protein AAGD12_04415 [Pseudomonadota bacterium]